MKGSSQNSICIVNQYPLAIGLIQFKFPTVLKHLVSSTNKSIIEETAQSGISLM